jgi:titin
MATNKMLMLQNGKKVSPDIRHKTLEEDGTHTLLIIESLPEDSGKYECVAINSSGEARCEAECIVKSPSASKPHANNVEPEGPASAPRILEKLTDKSVSEGQSVHFKCTVAGKPSMTFQLEIFRQVVNLFCFIF